jgi:xanthine/uracil permease
LIGIAVSAGTAMQIVRTNIQGAMIVAGAVLLVAGLLGVIRRLRFLFTGRITGVLLTLIAIQISSVGVRGLIRNGPGMFVIGTGVLVLALLLLTRTRGILRNSALLLTVVIGWVISALLGLAPGAATQGTPLLALPTVFPWGAPTFDLGSIFSLTILGLLMIPNLVGAVKALEQATGQDVSSRHFDRGLAVSGFTCGLAGISGGIGTVPFAVSVGLVSVTGERTNRAFLMGAGLFILIGIVPPLGQFFSSIPETIASAVLLISVSSLGVIGLRSAARDAQDIRGSFVVGIGLLIGGGIMFVPGEFWAGTPYWLSSVLSNGAITGTLVAMVLEQTILRAPKKAES